MSVTVPVPIEVAEQLFKKNHKVRTVEDLWRIPIDETKIRPIRPVLDLTEPTWSVEDLNWDAAWSSFSRTRAKAYAEQQLMHRFAHPEIKNWFDRARFALHVKLVKWGIVI